MNRSLAIAIPTYNRPEILAENIELMFSDIVEYQIPIYISDDSNNDTTREKLQKIFNGYDNLIYRKNAISLGHDRNCLETLRMPKEKFIWYLGDCQVIKKNSIKLILEIIEENKSVSAIIISSEGREIAIPSQKYIDIKKLFIELTWHVTLTGCTVYNRAYLFNHDYEKYVGSNFIQVGIIFEEFFSKAGIIWINEKLIYRNSRKNKSYWRETVFEVFAKDWCKFINSLPIHSSERDKLEVLKSHSINTHILSFKNMRKYRMQGILNLKSYTKYYHYLKLSSDVNILIILVIALLPKPMLKLPGFITGLKQKKSNLDE